MLIPPKNPVWEIEVRRGSGRPHPLTRNGLHLQMQEDPCDYQNENHFEGGAPACEDDLDWAEGLLVRKAAKLDAGTGRMDHTRPHSARHLKWPRSAEGLRATYLKTLVP